MLEIKKILRELSDAIERNQFIDRETSIIELKDLSTGGDWNSLKETVCAYLNTNGGWVICGIREKNKTYKFTGFDRNNEAKLSDDLLKHTFKNDADKELDVSDWVDLDYFPFQDGIVAVVSVRPLSEDLKYIKYKDDYFERVLTGDKKILKDRLATHKEYKLELESAKEIRLVENATIEDLELNKINQFIVKINQSGKKETIKTSVYDAQNFLDRRHCVNAEGKVTVLGMLLFGKEPFQFLEQRSEVNCYFETRNSIGKDKKYFQDDVLTLIEDSFNFIWGHIKVGRSYIGGGRSEPEYTEQLTREVINNAVAHRDYTLNRFITIKVNPGESLEIQNPGTFKAKMLLLDITDAEKEVRRIIPGIPESKNPKLANVLKAFDKIESQGIGMSTLVSECLENNIDVPYYNLSIPDSISLVIPSGKLIDEDTDRWLNSYNTYLEKRLKMPLNDEHKAVLAYLLKSEKLNQKRYYTILFSPNNNHFDALRTLESCGIIEKHQSASTESQPVYILNKLLNKEDFSKEIENIFKKYSKAENFVEWELFSVDTKQVLFILYRHNYFNEKILKPSDITPELYSILYGKEINPKRFESLGRKVRGICKTLSDFGIVEKFSNGAYRLYL